MTLLEAIDRLNSWVRSDSARGWWASPRYAIYDWKNHLIEEAIRAGRAECSAIHLSLTCRACGGTGKYTDWHGIKYPNCRKCSSKGVVRLEFLVTRIDAFTWHTPKDRTWRFHLAGDFWQNARLSVDWEPNAKGRNLELWQLAECLNVCEEAVQRGELCKPGFHGEGYGGDEYEVNHGKYKLNLGRGARVCQICGAAASADETDYSEGSMHGIMTDHLEWSAWACNTCRDANGGRNTCKIFDVLKLYPPLARMQHPEIQAWLRRRVASVGMPAEVAHV